MTMTSKALERQLERVRKLEGNVTFQFSIIAKLMDNDAMALLAETPLNLTAYRLMRTVETFETISIADLGRHMVTDTAQISRTATDLGTRGLVTFEADPKNKRRKLVVLTPEGQRLMDDLAPRFEARRARIEGCLGTEELAHLRDACARLAEHFTD